MPSRKTPRLSFNATAPTSGQDTAATILPTGEANAELDAARQAVEADTALAQGAARRSSFLAHAQIVPTDTSNVNPRTRSRFAGPTQVRRLSDFKRRQYSAERNRVFDAASAARSYSMDTLRDDARREARLSRLNETLRRSHGDQRRLASNLRSRQVDIDRTIRTAEAGNTREHTVYVATDINQLPGDTSSERLAALRDQIENNDGHYVVNGYMVGSHDMSEAVHDGRSNEIVLEIKTSSGAYLGNSDGQDKDATHILGRNRHLLPVSIQEDVPYERADGTQGRRTIVQMQDVTPDIWADNH